MNIHHLNSTDSDFSIKLKNLCKREKETVIIKEQVQIIADDVCSHGDEALLRLTAKYDKHVVNSVSALKVKPQKLEDAFHALDTELIKYLELAATRLRTYHEKQRPQNWSFKDVYGSQLGERWLPVKRAIIYVPGGKAIYPSSVLMAAIPAKIAGVEDIIITTPAIEGEVSEVTLAAAYIAGVNCVYLLGGAQAIIGFAYGTETLPQADVIVGPGNAYVAEAKRQVYGQVGLDSVAGPSEVLIISDRSTNPHWVAADMLSQAEHDERAQVILLSFDKQHLVEVEIALNALLQSSPRREIIEASLAQYGAIIWAPDINRCCEIANQIASEHVQIMTESVKDLPHLIHNAGALFIGANSPVALGDYVAGSNHVLPTGGTARFASSLGVLTFMKRTSVLEASPQGMQALAPAVEYLAKAEGLFTHATSAKLRLK